MPDQTLVQGVADLRLSDTRLRQDLANARSLLFRAADDIEQRLRLEIPVDIDASRARSQLRRITDVLRSDLRGGITVPVNVDTDNVVAGLEAVAAISEPVTVSVDADTAPLRAAVDRVSADLSVQEPVVLPIDVPYGPVDDFNTYAATSIPPQFEETGREAGSQFGNALSSTLKGIFTTTALTLGGFLATSLVRGFQRLSTIEDATASLTVQLESATDAATLLDEVLDVVRGTPFNLDQFAEAASNLVAFGVEADKIPGYLTAIGEASATRGSRAAEFAQRLAFSFGQIAVAGRITNEEIQSIQLAGVDALSILGNAAGKTSFEMRELISKGLVPADEALDTLTDGIVNGSTGINGATVAFAGTMENLRKTLTGAIGGFKSATARLGVAIIEPLQETLTVGFNAASGALDNFGEAIQRNLAGLADSPEIQQFREVLAGLPDVAVQAIEALSGLGPALAPLAAITAGFGLGAIGDLLGPLGNLIPGISGPIGVLTVGITALVATTPELREEFLPILAGIATAAGEVATILGPALSDAVTALIPVLRTLFEIVDDLLPVLTNAAVAGAALLSGIVPAIELLAAGLDAVPVPVLVALTAFFAANRLLPNLTRPFEGLVSGLRDLETAQRAVENTFDERSFIGAQRGLENTRESVGGATNALNQMGISAQTMSRVVNTAAVSVGGALSGLALASEDTSIQVTGALGAIGSIAAGFATGGPYGAAFAAGATALGFIAGGFIEARREAAEFERTYATVAESIVADIDEVNLALGDQLDIIGQFGQIKDSEAATKAFIDGLGEDFVRALNEAGDIGFDVFDLDPDAIDPAIEGLKELENVAYDLTGQAAFLDEFWGLFFAGFDETGPIWREIEDGILKGVVTPTGEAAVAAEYYLELLGRQQTALGDLKAQDVTLSTADPELIGEVIGLLEKRGKAEAVLADQLRVELEAEQALQTVTENRFREELAAYGLREAAIERYIELARESEDQSPIDLYNLDVANQYYDAFPGIIEPIEEATLDVEAATELWADRLEEIIGQFDVITDQLDAVGAQGDAAAALRGISEGLSEVINESELRKAERIGDQIDRQLERVEDAADKVRDAARDFAYDEQIALANIAEAEAAGAFKGAAAARRDLERDRQQVIDLQDDLAEEEAKLAELQAEKAGLSTTPVTFGDVLQQQAAEQGLSIFDLLFTQPTDESQEAFKKFVDKPAKEALQAITSELEANGVEAAADAARTYRADLEREWSAEFGPATAARLLESFFDVDETIVRLDAEAWVQSFSRGVDESLEDFRARVQATSLSDEDFAAGEAAEFIAIVQGILDDEELTVALGIDPDELAELEAALEAFRLQQEADFLDFGIQWFDPVTGEFLPPGSVRKPGQTYLAADGGIVEFFKSGGIRPTENHVAHIARDTIRVFAEPETGGEAYIPLAQSKRARSERILRDVASMFNMEVTRQVDLPRSMSPVSATVSNTHQIAEAVTVGVSRAIATQQRAQIAADYASAVHVENLNIGRASSDRRTSRHVVEGLAQLALKRRR